MNEKELRDLILQSSMETRQHFDVVAEGLKREVQLVAEGVTNVGHKVDRVDSEMHREFDDVRAMVRLSYTELDRRLRTLEESLSVLERRMDRLESQSAQ